MRGGANNYDESLKSGAAVLEHIDREKYDPRDIFIDRQGAWHMHGLAVPAEKALFGVDVAFNVLADHAVGRTLESLAVPHTGPDAFASGLLADPHRFKHQARTAGVRVAHGVLVEREDPEALAHRLFRTFPQPARVGGLLAENFYDFHSHLARALDTADRVYIEEHIPGRLAQVGVIRHFRNEPLYALIPAPTDLTREQKEAVAALARTAHEALGLGHYSHLHFTVSRRGVYFAGVDAHPVLHQDSGLAAGLKAVGSSLKEFISHVLHWARK